MSSRDKWAQAAVVGASLVHLTWLWAGVTGWRGPAGSVSVSEGVGLAHRKVASPGCLGSCPDLCHFLNLKTD